MAKWGTRQGAVMQGHLKEGHLAWLGIHGKVGYQTGCCDVRTPKREGHLAWLGIHGKVGYLRGCCDAMAPKRWTSSMVRDTWQSGVPDRVL